MERPYKILIIDDNEKVLDVLYNFLRKKKYDVVSASNGLDGLKSFEAEKDGLDLVITDLVMPNISGVAVITIVKQKYPDLPVIAITGWGEHPEALAIESNADMVFKKPFKLSEVDKAITDLLSSKRANNLS